MVKFPLIMTDGTKARTIEDLREHFDLQSVLSYYNNGKLVSWLESRYYDKEANEISQLDPASDDFKKDLCNILGVEYVEEEANKVNLDDISQKNEHRAKLKQYTADDAVLSNADKVAFTQKELSDLLNKGEKEIYVCGDRFVICDDFENVTYIGVNAPELIIFENISNKNIVFRNIGKCTDISDYKNPDPEIIQILKQEAENGMVPAQYYIKKLFLLGYGSESEYKESETFFKELTEQGNTDVMRELGELYFNNNDYDKAVKMYEKAADNGDINARCKLGELYYNNKDYDQAVRWYRRAAYKSSDEAMYKLGCCYYDGTGVDENLNEAEKWFQKAADKGNTEAMCKLGDLVLCDDDDDNKNKAVEWYQKAANNGNINGMKSLGWCYLNGYGVDKDDNEAAKWYNKIKEKNELSSWVLGALKGDADALCKLGDCCYNGYNNGVYIFEDGNKAVEWYKKAADKGNTEAVYKLGRCYYDGTVVDEDLNEAKKWFQKAAENGNSDAMYYLGCCYYYDDTGADEDLNEAKKWFQKAAENGNSDAMCQLGDLVLCDDDDDKNKAVEWYEKAADKGNTEAMYNLGDIYFKGKGGINRDYNKAVKWYEKAADNGDYQSMECLAWCYLNGYGVEKDDNKAVKWYDKINNQTKGKNKLSLWVLDALQGDTDALCKLGNCCYYGHYEGVYVVKDENKAVEWYKKAAENGNAEAMCKLGNCYFVGEAVDEDHNKAIEWYEKAAENGNAEAMYKLGRCWHYGWGNRIDIPGVKGLFGFDLKKYEYQDDKKAIEWYQKAADMGNFEAMLQLGDCYLNGWCGVPINEHEALKWYQAVADNADAKSYEYSCALKGLEEIKQQS